MREEFEQWANTCASGSVTEPARVSSRRHREVLDSNGDGKNKGQGSSPRRRAGLFSNKYDGVDTVTSNSKAAQSPSSHPMREMNKNMAPGLPCEQKLKTAQNHEEAIGIRPDNAELRRRLRHSCAENQPARAGRAESQRPKDVCLYCSNSRPTHILRNLSTVCASEICST